MNIVEADLWEVEQDIPTWVFATASGKVKEHSGLVMGRGAAQEMAEKYRFVPRMASQHLRAGGGELCSEPGGVSLVYRYYLISLVKPGFSNHRQEVTDDVAKLLPNIDWGINIPPRHVGVSQVGNSELRSKPLRLPGLGLFQTRLRPEEKGDLEVIRKSLYRLAKFALQFLDHEIRVDFPGIGYGRLPREVIEPMLHILPKNVVVYLPSYLYLNP